jgi:hypothetical protein
MVVADKSTMLGSVRRRRRAPSNDAKGRQSEAAFKLTVEPFNAHLDDAYAAMRRFSPATMPQAFPTLGLAWTLKRYPASSSLSSRPGQRYRSGTEPSLRLCEAVKGSREDLLGDRKSHHRQNLPSEAGCGRVGRRGDPEIPISEAGVGEFVFVVEDDPDVRAYSVESLRELGS